MQNTKAKLYVECNSTIVVPEQQCIFFLEYQRLLICIPPLTTTVASMTNMLLFGNIRCGSDVHVKTKARVRTNFHILSTRSVLKAFSAGS